MAILSNFQYFCSYNIHSLIISCYFCQEDVWSLARKSTDWNRDGQDLVVFITQHPINTNACCFLINLNMWKGCGKAVHLSSHIVFSLSSPQIPLTMQKSKTLRITWLLLMHNSCLEYEHVWLYTDAIGLCCSVRFYALCFSNQALQAYFNHEKTIAMIFIFLNSSSY